MGERPRKAVRGVGGTLSLWFESLFQSPCAVAILPGFFSRVQEILLVALRARHAAGTNLKKLQSERVQAFAYRQYSPFLKSFALNDAAGTDFVARQFELRLDED